jgi:long-chain acyl-CoA synthetase
LEPQERVQTLADILPAGRARWPDRIALQHREGDAVRNTTYAELARLADGFASQLCARGVRARDRVAILMPNGRPWITAYFGTLQCGAVAVPLEHEFLHTGPEHIAFALEHSQSRMVVVAPEDADAVAEIASPAHVEVLSFSGAPEPASPPGLPQISPSDLAQILYTSGTTGRKKGVALSHANVVSNVRACCERFRVREDDCLPALLPHHHAYPLTTTVALPLYGGARMPVGDVRDRRTPEFLRAVRPTVLVGVPRVFEAMLDGIESAARKQGRLDSLRRTEAFCATVWKWTGLNLGPLAFRGLHRQLFGGTQLRLCVSGGARLPRELALRYLQLGIPLLQGWGMTELSPVGTVQHYSPWRFCLTRHYWRRAGSIGSALAGTEIRLVDVPEQDVVVERDGRGEMVVRGPQVMVGYYRDPDATARVKTPDGLRTGDIGRRDPDGNWHVVGRAKHVIVLPGGKKVFPEEDLSEDLAQCPCIEQFVVRAITDGGEEKIGIIVKPDADVLRERGIGTVREMYAALKAEIAEALAGKPDYVRRFDFCLTELRGGEFGDLVRSSMKEPCPLKNEFRFETAWSRRKDDDAPLELRAN